MFSTVYISESTAAFQVDDLPALVAQASDKNGKAGLTGLLLYRDDRFLQTLEGPEQTVRALMAAITADPRHDHIRVLAEEQIEQRRFPDWSMVCPQVADADAEARLGSADLLAHAREGLQAFPSRTALLLHWFQMH